MAAADVPEYKQNPSKLESELSPSQAPEIPLPPAEPQEAVAEVVALSEVPPEANLTVEVKEPSPQEIAVARKFAAHLLKGKTKTDAAKAIGIPADQAKAAGNSIAKSQALKNELRAQMAAAGLDVDNSLIELKRGLQGAKLGPHHEYLKIQLKMLELLSGDPGRKKSQAPGQDNSIWINIVQEAQRRGTME